MNLDSHLDTILRRHGELGARLAAGAAGSDFADASREYAELEPLADAIRALRAKQKERAELAAMLADPALEPDMREIAAAEFDETGAALAAMTQEIRVALLPKDTADDNNVILEVRAGTGGDEAALFAGDLFRMYVKYAEGRGWKVDVLSESEGTAGGYKEIIAEVAGRGAYARFKFESGVHRVQRVPATETQGRIHTSAATVAVMPEAQEIDVDIKDSDLKVDTMRASGAGGQHVNKTEFGDPHHPSADRHRRGGAGGALAAQEPRPGDVAIALAHLRRRARARRRRARQGAARPGRLRRPVAADPHL